MPITSRHRVPITSVNLFNRVNADLQLSTMRDSGTVHSIVHRIASDVARQHFCLHHDPGGGNTTTNNNDGDTRIDDHAFLRLWARPNDKMTPTGRAFRQLAGTYLELLGEAAILVVSLGNKPGSQPVELWPIRPDRLTPVPDPFDWLAGWIYTSEDGERTPLRPDQIIQLKYPDPLDPYRGLSPLRAAMVDVDSAGFANEWQRQFFLNSALPGGIVTTDEHLTPGDFREWVERWNQQHQGVNNAGRVSLMDKGGKFISQQMSMVDMQLTDLVEANRGGIREAWGISKTILGQNEDVNRATALAAQQIYGRYTLEDRADLWKEAGNELVRRYTSSGAGPGRASRLRVEIDGALTPEDVEIEAKDRDSRVQAAVSFIRAGADPAAALDHFGFPDIEFDQTRQQPEPGEQQPALPAGPPELAARAGLTPPKAWAAVAAAGDTLNDDQLPDVSHLETEFQDQLAGLLAVWADLETDQKAAVLAAVVGLAATGTLADLTRITIDSTAAAAELEDAMAELADKAAEAAADEAKEQGATIDPVAPDRSVLRDAAIVVAALLARRLVSGAVNTAMRANGPTATPSDIEEAVSEHLDGLSKDGPKPLLGGALTGAQNDGRIATADAAFVVGDVFASEQNDKNTCGPCRAIHGTWLGTTNDMAEIRAAYPGGGFGGYVDCEGRERCRGTLVFVWPPDLD